MSDFYSNSDIQSYQESYSQQYQQSLQQQQLSQMQDQPQSRHQEWSRQLQHEEDESSSEARSQQSQQQESSQEGQQQQIDYSSQSYKSDKYGPFGYSWQIENPQNSDYAAYQQQQQEDQYSQISQSVSSQNNQVKNSKKCYQKKFKRQSKIKKQQKNHELTLYHGTGYSAAKSIKRNGFNKSSNNARLGSGVYFTDKKQTAIKIAEHRYGKGCAVIQCRVKAADLTVEQHKWLLDYPNQTVRTLQTPSVIYSWHPFWEGPNTTFMQYCVKQLSIIQIVKIHND